MRAQGSIVHIVGDIIAQLNSTALFARKMLGKFLTTVDVPELMLVALHSNSPGVIKKLSFVVQWRMPNINKGFSADGHIDVNQ